MIKNRLYIMSILTQISEQLQKGDPKGVRELVLTALGEGIPAKEILDRGLLASMKVIGRKFSNNEIFIPEVFNASAAMNLGINTLKPFLAMSDTASIGTACIGTVSGDLHDIGKNLVKLMMEGRGIRVIDLGSNVEPRRFVDAIREHDCQLVCCSAFLTTTMYVMQEVVELIKAEGLRDKVRIMVGGAPISHVFCRHIDADHYAPDAASAADLAVRLLNAMRKV